MTSAKFNGVGIFSAAADTTLTVDVNGTNIGITNKALQQKLMLVLLVMRS